jgi:hypothetical protein
VDGPGTLVVPGLFQIAELSYLKVERKQEVRNVSGWFQQKPGSDMSDVWGQSVA